MQNQNNNNQANQENSSFYDQADGKFKDMLAKGVAPDEEENSGKTYSKNLMDKADSEVRENEDASLQDDSYSFDEDNTDNEEYHDVDSDFDPDNSDDFVQ